jgi:hypothetical protein
MEDDRELLENLRLLADDGPREAPARLEWRLRLEFRRQHRARIANRWASFIGVAAMAAGIAVFVWMREAPKHAAPTHVAATVMASDDADADMNFFPLPEAEALPAIENAMVVRVQMPASSLRRIGLAVDEDGGDAAIQAELLVGQDGLPRGVRPVE